MGCAQNPRQPPVFLMADVRFTSEHSQGDWKWLLYKSGSLEQTFGSVTLHCLGSRRQISFIVKANHRKDISVEWMKRRVDSPMGKECYAQRMAADIASFNFSILAVYSAQLLGTSRYLDPSWVNGYFPHQVQ